MVDGLEHADADDAGLLRCGHARSVGRRSEHRVSEATVADGRNDFGRAVRLRVAGRHFEERLVEAGDLELGHGLRRGRDFQLVALTAGRRGCRLHREAELHVANRARFDAVGAGSGIGRGRRRCRVRTDALGRFRQIDVPRVHFNLERLLVARTRARFLHHDRLHVPRLEPEHLLALERVGERCRHRQDAAGVSLAVRVSQHWLRGGLLRRRGRRGLGIRLDAILLVRGVEHHRALQVALIDRDDAWKLDALPRALDVHHVLGHLRALLVLRLQLHVRRRLRRRGRRCRGGRGRRRG